MKIRNKILVYFSITVIVLSAISLTVIYVLFSEYREEEFQQLQSKKIEYTIGLIAEFKEMSEELALMLDAQDIHDFYDEKLLIFDGQKNLIFSSLDSLPIHQTTSILTKLSPARQWVETKEGDYDLVGVYRERDGKSYYAISKALDAFGYSKLYFLRNVIIAIFVAISVIVTLLSLYLSNIISKPIKRLADRMNRYDLASENISLLTPDTSSFELNHLTERFNDLLKRTHEAFAFQKNAIHHISHELKTPVAVLVSELERTKSYADIDEMKAVLDVQIKNTKSLGEIINTFLEISKFESGEQTHTSEVRIDEVLFDIVQELQLIYPHFRFDINFFPLKFDDNRLSLQANKMLIKQAFQNLMINCISYGSEPNAQLLIDCSQAKRLLISISNIGPPVTPEEVPHLFKHSFRGRNSEGKVGFGLGLVLAKKIMDYHQGTISYSNPANDLNVFKVQFL